VLLIRANFIALANLSEQVLNNIGQGVFARSVILGDALVTLPRACKSAEYEHLISASLPCTTHITTVTRLLS
jgi:hypothetical protein